MSFIYKHKLIFWQAIGVLHNLSNGKDCYSRIWEDVWGVNLQGCVVAARTVEGRLPPVGSSLPVLAVALAVGLRLWLAEMADGDGDGDM